MRPKKKNKKKLYNTEKKKILLYSIFFFFFFRTHLAPVDNTCIRVLLSLSSNDPICLYLHPMNVFFGILISTRLVRTQLKNIKVTQTFTLSEHSKVKRVDQIKVGRVGNLNFTYIVSLVVIPNNPVVLLRSRWLL